MQAIISNSNDKIFQSRAKVYFRFPGPGKRISYLQLKKGLLTKQIKLPLHYNYCLSENFQRIYKKKQDGWKTPCLGLLTPT